MPIDPLLRWRHSLRRSTSTASLLPHLLCFSMNEGMLIFGGSGDCGNVLRVLERFLRRQLVVRLGSRGAVRRVTPVQCCNHLALCQTKKWCGALALIASFSGTLLTLLAAFSASHPPNCDNDDVVDDKPLGAHTRTRTALSSLHVHSTCVLLLRVLQDRWCHTYCGPPTRACSCPSSAGSPPQPSAAARSTCGTCVCFWRVLRSAAEDSPACTGPL